MTDMEIQSVILDEIRALRASFQLSAERLSRVETHVESMVGNVQPGRLTLLENKVSDLQKWRWTTTGAYMGISAIVSAAIAVIFHLWK